MTIFRQPWSALSSVRCTCLKKLETVTVTGRKLHKLKPASSVVEDQLPLLSCIPSAPRRSNEPRLDHDPEPPDSVPPFRLNWSKLLVLLFRSKKSQIKNTISMIWNVENDYLNCWLQTLKLGRTLQHLALSFCLFPYQYLTLRAVCCWDRCQSRRKACDIFLTFRSKQPRLL